jgi:hypothetical protein
MQYVIIAEPSDNVGIVNLLRDCQADSRLPEGVVAIGDRAWTADEHKAFLFCATLASNAASRKVKIHIFRTEDDAKIL